MKWIISSLVLNLLLFNQQVIAEDYLSAVMARMQHQSAVKIRYKEIRHLELMDEPWQGSGYLYALSPDLMIKEQWYPQKEIMAVNADKLYYYDPVNNRRHQSQMTADNPLSLNIAVFKALINHDKGLLEEYYQIEFCSKAEQWLLTLIPKQQTALAKIVVTGLPEQAANTISIYQKDGDYNEFSLKKEGEGETELKMIKIIAKQLNIK